jgi:hypothetical protein
VPRHSFTLRSLTLAQGCGASPSSLEGDGQLRCLAIASPCAASPSLKVAVPRLASRCGASPRSRLRCLETLEVALTRLASSCGASSSLEAALPRLASSCGTRHSLLVGGDSPMASRFFPRCCSHARSWLPSIASAPHCASSDSLALQCLTIDSSTGNFTTRESDSRPATSTHMSFHQRDRWNSLHRLADDSCSGAIDSGSRPLQMELVLSQIRQLPVKSTAMQEQADSPTQTKPPVSFGLASQTGPRDPSIPERFLFESGRQHRDRIQQSKAQCVSNPEALSAPSCVDPSPALSLPNRHPPD